MGLIFASSRILQFQQILQIKLQLAVASKIVFNEQLLNAWQLILNIESKLGWKAKWDKVATQF